MLRMLLRGRHGLKAVTALWVSAVVLFGGGMSHASNYLDAVTKAPDGRFILWPSFRNPIRVHVIMMDSEQAFALPLIRDSLDAWQNASGDRLRFVLTPKANKAHIVIRLRSGPLDEPVSSWGDTDYRMPEVKWKSHRLYSVAMILNTGTSADAEDPAGRDAQFYRLALHELGHALGIRGHSAESSDIMFSHPTAANLSDRDVETLRKLYKI